jgi:hypothetical protein
MNLFANYGVKASDVWNAISTHPAN